MWLECIGVVSGCCCKEVYRFPHPTYNNYIPTRLDIVISTRTSTSSPETSMFEVPSNTIRKLRADSVYSNGVIEVSLLHV